MKCAGFLLASALAAVLPLSTLSAQSVPEGIEIAPGSTLLSVTAQGQTFAEPDIAVFSAGITTQGSNAAKALGENSRVMARMIAALKRIGIAERDIQTSNLSLNPVYRDLDHEARLAARVTDQPVIPPPPESHIPQIIGYTASNTISVRQRDLADYGQVIDALVSEGVNQVSGPNLQVEAEQDATDKARIEAVAIARQRAQLYAQAAGLRVQRILSINEGGGYSGPPAAFQRSIAVSASRTPPPMQPGELQMTASITVLFELAP